MQKELYDTNILIEHWRKNKRTLNGYTTIISIIEFPKALKIKGLTVLYPTNEDYEEAIKISIDLLKQGTPIGASDTIIAAIAINRDLTLITMDNDFKHIKTIRKNLNLKIIEKHPTNKNKP